MTQMVSKEQPTKQQIAAWYQLQAALAKKSEQPFQPLHPFVKESK